MTKQSYQRKLTYDDLDRITLELYQQISSEFTPAIILHLGIRTTYLVEKSEDFFNVKPFIVNTARDFPMKKIMRKIFYDMFNLLPDDVADYLVDHYIKIVHSKNRKPSVISFSENLPEFNSSKILILDDVFCTGDTIQAVREVVNIYPEDLKSGVLIWTPYNGEKPDFYVIEGKHSLPWRNIGV